MYINMTFFSSTGHSCVTLYFAVCIVISREAALEARRVLVGVQVSPTSGARRVHYCPALNLFVVYRRRAAKWYPILWYPYGVRRSGSGEGPPCERDTCCYITSPIVVAMQPRCSAAFGTVSVGER